MPRILHSEQSFLDYRDGSGATVEIFEIVVKGAERRKGIGRQLITRLVRFNVPSDCTLVWAITRATNKIAREFYEGVGFRVVANLDRFYKDDNIDGVDAIMYGLDITPGS